jgi:hypothetical protein
MIGTFISSIFYNRHSCASRNLEPCERSLQESPDSCFRRHDGWLMAVFLLFCSPTFAADYTVGAKTGCPPTIQHKPAKDVAYQPGVDAQGWAVTPAEVTPPTLTAEDLQQIDIPVRMPLSQENLSHGERSKAAQQISGEGESASQQPPNPATNAANPLPHQAPFLQNAPSSASPHGRGEDLSFIQPGVVSVNTQDGSVTFNGKDLRPLTPAELDPDCISQKTP